MITKILYDNAFPNVTEKEVMSALQNATGQYVEKFENLERENKELVFKITISVEEVKGE